VDGVAGITAAKRVAEGLAAEGRIAARSGNASLAAEFAAPRVALREAGWAAWIAKARRHGAEAFIVRITGRVALRRTLRPAWIADAQIEAGGGRSRITGARVALAVVVPVTQNAPARTLGLTRR
jgi:hypothetical protein